MISYRFLSLTFFYIYTFKYSRERPITEWSLAANAFRQLRIRPRPRTRGHSSGTLHHLNLLQNSTLLNIVPADRTMKTSSVFLKLLVQPSFVTLCVPKFLLPFFPQLDNCVTKNQPSLVRNRVASTLSFQTFSMCDVKTMPVVFPDCLSHQF